MAFKQFRRIEEGEFFVIAADPSAGLGDNCACQFLSKTHIDVPLIYHSPQIATQMTNDIIPVIEKISDITRIKPILAYERNNGGVFEMERIASMNRLGKFDIFKMPTLGTSKNPEAVKYGWDTNTATRPAMLSELKEAIDNKVLKLYDEQTINEMFSFIRVKTTATVKAQAEEGAHDDLVMSLAIAWQLYQQSEAPHDDKYYEQYQPTERQKKQFRIGV